MDASKAIREQRDSQLAETPEQAHGAQIESRLKDLHTCLPGIVVSFDGATQTATVQPAIQRIFTDRGAVNLPVCVDVPVAFPGGGDFFLTFPVKAGDECILMFSERAIDYWYAAGGTQQPAEYRLHDLSDGMALVGLNSQPRKITAFASNDVELRNRERTVRVTMKPDQTIEAVNGAGNYALAPSGNFTVNAPQTTINSPVIVLNGNVTFIGNLDGQAGNGGDGNASIAGTVSAETDVVVGSVSLASHTHSDVEPGVGTSGPPV